MSTPIVLSKRTQSPSHSIFCARLHSYFLRYWYAYGTDTKPQTDTRCVCFLHKLRAHATTIKQLDRSDWMCIFIKARHWIEMRMRHTHSMRRNCTLKIRARKERISKQNRKSTHTHTDLVQILDANRTAIKHCRVRYVLRHSVRYNVSIHATNKRTVMCDTRGDVVVVTKRSIDSIRCFSRFMPL